MMECNRDTSAYYAGPCVRGRVYIAAFETNDLYGSICAECLKNQRISRELEAAKRLSDPADYCQDASENEFVRSAEYKRRSNEAFRKEKEA